MLLNIVQRGHKETHLEPMAIVVRVCGGAPRHSVLVMREPYPCCRRACRLVVLSALSAQAVMIREFVMTENVDNLILECLCKLASAP
jgi:hypothetical protein